MSEDFIEDFIWSTDLSLSPEARQSLRRAIREHPGLDEGERPGVHLMDKATLIGLARDLKLDPARVFKPEMLQAMAGTSAPAADTSGGVSVSPETAEDDPEPLIEALGSDAPPSDIDPVAQAESLAIEALCMPLPELRAALTELYAERLAPKPAAPVIMVGDAVGGGRPGPGTGSAPVTYRKLGNQTVGKVFGIKMFDGFGKELAVDIYDYPRAPEKDPQWIWDPTVLRALVTSSRSHAPTWLHGMPGTGKTQAVTQFAAATGRPLVRINLDGTSERYEWFGGERMRGGDIVWEDGALIAGLRLPGCVILLDEPTTGRPDNLSALHPVLEAGGRITIAETGEVLRPAPGVMFAAADNTAGTGDDSGLFSGTREMNRAMLSRFATVVEVEFLKPKDEKALLKSKTGCSEDLSAIVVDMATRLRAKVSDGALDYPPGPRELVAWIGNLQAGFPPVQAYTMAVAKGQSPAGREVVASVYKAAVDDDARITSALRGTKFEADLL